MRTVSGLFLTLAIGAATGLGLTALSVGRGTGAGILHVGPWIATPKAGTTEADPYARAVTARLGTLPLALADGLALIAETDDQGQPLDGRCTIRITGDLPPARFWTVTVADPAFRPLVADSVRQGFTSYEVVRQQDKPIDVTVAPAARPGNWLPSGGAPSIRLILRLYDTPVATTISAGVTLPSIQRVSCP
ncbi:DUF1214 domain-containing protein [Phreatobacter aquaticus]|uniref:DUF1214 domain-containing protein n=1 Tax=Phreatobacter aquaticus TaxID=2570229 RepID=A0A4D7QLS5_9HYPH|nr:DUF1214 domain-containing protein [Phreatobacter aquaticus]QCK86599.1 DUF1214 domain-containing protein [Phreatobacter aquaticus]